MSQHMNFDEMERGYQPQAPYSVRPESSPIYDDAFSGLSGQKLGKQYKSRSVSAGQRLALAIVSLFLLLGAAGIILEPSAADAGILGLIELGIVSLVVIIVNVVF